MSWLFPRILLALLLNQVHQTNSQHMAPQVWESSSVAAGSSSVGKGLDFRAAVASRSAFWRWSSCQEGSGGKKSYHGGMDDVHIWFVGLLGNKGNPTFRRACKLSSSPSTHGSDFTSIITWLTPRFRVFVLHERDAILAGALGSMPDDIGGRTLLREPVSLWASNEAGLFFENMSIPVLITLSDSLITQIFAFSIPQSGLGAYAHNLSCGKTWKCLLSPNCRVLGTPR